jgi:RimJ/RimL family protein N-acetyltransferase
MNYRPLVEVVLRQLSLQESMDISAGVRPATGWANDFPQRGDVAATRYTSSLAGTERLPWSASWLIVANGLVAGTIGFKGAPDHGEVEVGYGVVPSLQGRGIATSALTQLLDIVGDHDLRIKAETAAWNVASQQVVLKAGFVEVERRMTNEDGELIVWRREHSTSR